MDFFDNFDAHHGSGLYSSIPDGTGLNTIMHDGMAVDTLTDLGTHVGDFTMPNVDGGLDVYEDGQLVSHSVPNAMGGHTMYEGTLVKKLSIAGIDGQSDYYDSDMNHLGHTSDNIFGGEDLMVNDTHSDSAFDAIPFDSHSADFTVNPGNVNDILSTQDPLRYSHELVLPDFKV